MTKPRKPAPKTARYLNREFSWLDFNSRVLAEALVTTTPLLERLKFLAIVSSNLDEFFMVRVASLWRQVARGDRRLCMAGLEPTAQLAGIRQRVLPMLRAQYRAFADLVPQLAAQGVRLLRPEDYTPEQRVFAADLFDREVFPALTPLAVRPDEPLPISGNRRLHLAFLVVPLTAPNAVPQCAVVQLPPALERLRQLPTDRGSAWGLLEDLVLQNANKLFPGYDIVERALFRVSRDADLSVTEERDEDFVEAMAEVLRQRQTSRPVRVEITAAGRELRRRIPRLLGVSAAVVYDVPGPLDLRVFMKVAAASGLDALRDPPWLPQWPRELPAEATLWDVLKHRDLLFHHPYESFDPVVRWFGDAAEDPFVLAIKVTLYRTSGQSAIVRALARAAENGKQVTAVIELKARFDEEQNITWVRQLERAGAIVIYGIANLKIHAKAALIVRREPEGVRRYVHLSTGNYNETTARLYTDFGLLSSDDELAYELTHFFNTITGYSTLPPLRQLAVAPTMLRTRFEELVEREIARSTPHQPGLILAKLNSLVCPRMIDLLYRASQAGVRIRLNVRGMCCLRPGVPGLSENIQVVSILDRFLEHSRIFYFQNGNAGAEVYLGSADWMPRNLDKRIELLFPIRSAGLRERLKEALGVFLADNVKGWNLHPDGRYERRRPRRTEVAVRAQEVFYRDACARAEEAEPETSKRFVVRRKPLQT